MPIVDKYLREYHISKCGKSLPQHCKEYRMSFKNFSSALGATVKIDPDDKSRNAPSADQPSVRPGEMPADVEFALTP